MCYKVFLPCDELNQVGRACISMLFVGKKNSKGNHCVRAKKPNECSHNIMNNTQILILFNVWILIFFGFTSYLFLKLLKLISVRNK